MSACQHVSEDPDRSKAVDLPLMVSPSLRVAELAIRWPAAVGAPRISTERDELCAAYFRSAAGFNLTVDTPIHTDDHLLIVVTEGDLVIESAGVPFAVREGSSAVVPPGRWRLTEVPASGQVGYWLLFFGAALLTEAVGDDEQARQLASQVTLAYRGVFVQPHLLNHFHTWGQASPAVDVVQTIRAAAASMSASFYMYLREHTTLPAVRFKTKFAAGGWTERRRLASIGLVDKGPSGASFGFTMASA